MMGLLLLAALPRLLGGAPPALPAQTVGGGEVLLDVTVGAGGNVTDVQVLRTSEPFTAALSGAVRGWRFSPAGEAPYHVLVAGAFRPPALFGPTLGTPPADVGRPSADLPVPREMTLPPYPANAQGSGAVLLEVEVPAAGGAPRVSVHAGSAPFAAAAREVVATWEFTAARDAEGPHAARAWVVVGFAQPVVTGPPPQTR